MRTYFIICYSPAYLFDEAALNNVCQKIFFSLSHVFFVFRLKKIDANEKKKKFACSAFCTEKKFFHTAVFIFFIRQMLLLLFLGSFFSYSFASSPSHLLLAFSYPKKNIKINRVRTEEKNFLAC